MNTRNMTNRIYKTEVLVTGSFNVLHSGHVRLLEFANTYGEVTVGINNDWYVRQKYGDAAVPLKNRAYMLKSNIYVKDVYVFNEPDPSRLIYKLKPRFFVRGPDYAGVELPESRALEDVGCTLVIYHAQPFSDIRGKDYCKMVEPEAFLP